MLLEDRSQRLPAVEPPTRMRHVVQAISRGQLLLVDAADWD
jgi:hypothetical protein